MINNEDMLTNTYHTDESLESTHNYLDFLDEVQMVALDNCETIEEYENFSLADYYRITSAKS